MSENKLLEKYLQARKKEEENNQKEIMKSNTLNFNLMICYFKHREIIKKIEEGLINKGKVSIKFGFKIPCDIELSKESIFKKTELNDIAQEWAEKGVSVYNYLNEFVFELNEIKPIGNLKILPFEMDLKKYYEDYTKGRFDNE